MKKSKFIKSEAEDKFEIDEQLVNEISDSEEFKNVEITPEDVMDAIQAIDALADAVIEKADGEEKKIDADELLDQVTEMIDGNHEEEEVELEEEEVLPEELANSVIRVAVSDEDEITVEKDTPDEVYDSDVEGETCTVYDTCDEVPLEVEDTGNPEGDDLLIIGNSAAKKFKKGFVTLKSSASKKAWSSAYKKVRKMIGNAKMTAAHWVIVSALAKKEEEKEDTKKKLQSAIVKYIKSNNEMKSSLLKPLKSSNEFDTNGQPVSETKPDETAGKENPGFKEDEDPTKAKSPEQVDSASGNPTEDPDKQVEHEDDIVLPEEEIIVVEVPLTNSKRSLKLKKVASSKAKGCVSYIVQNANAALEKALDGKCVKSGKMGFLFKSTASGLLACAAKFVGEGKGNYTTVLKNGKVQIAVGESFPIFNSVEKTLIAQKLETAFKRGKLIGSSSRKPIKSAKKSVKSALDARYKNRIDWDELESEVERLKDSGYDLEEAAYYIFEENDIDQLNELGFIGDSFRVKYDILEAVKEIWDNVTYLGSSKKQIKSSRKENLKGYLNVGDYVEELDGDGWVAKVVDFNDDGSAIIDFVNGSGKTSISKEDIGENFEKIDIAEKIDDLIEDEKSFIEETGDKDDWYLNELLKIKRGITSSRKPVRSGCDDKSEKKSDKDEEIKSARKEAIRAKIQSHREIRKAQMLASQNEAKLRAMHDAEERERLFQSSQAVMNEEKIAIRQGVNRNSAALEKMYASMF